MERIDDALNVRHVQTIFRFLARTKRTRPDQLGKRQTVGPFYFTGEQG
jgi:hypothetical protein